MNKKEQLRNMIEEVANMKSRIHERVYELEEIVDELLDETDSLEEWKKRLTTLI